VSEGRMGLVPWNKGKMMDDEYIRKNSECHKGLQIGEDNPNWKGGITPLARHIRNSYKYRQWRSDVFTKDDFICQKLKGLL